jgi:hypothetical protein
VTGWVLILWVTYGGTVGVTSAVFADRASCDLALKAAKLETAHKTSSASGFCMPQKAKL